MRRGKAQLQPLPQVVRRVRWLCAATQQVLFSKNYRRVSCRRPIHIGIYSYHPRDYESRDHYP